MDWVVLDSTNEKTKMIKVIKMDW